MTASRDDSPCASRPSPAEEAAIPVLVRLLAAVLDSDEAAALRYLDRVRELSPTEQQKASISRGLNRVCKALGKTGDYARFVAALG